VLQIKKKKKRKKKKKFQSFCLLEGFSFVLIILIQTEENERYYNSNYTEQKSFRKFEKSLA
jgi:hypothetical protein